MTFDDKKQLLKEYRTAETLIFELGDRLYRWGQLQSKVADASRQDIEGIMAQLKGQISRLGQLRTAVERAIEGLEDYALRRIMQLRYIYGADWDSVADSVGYSRRQTFNLHKKALELLQFAEDCTNCTF
ncbi:MAG: hypothetical protein IJF58_04245 [Clostridia bacterium]|nr:hypothetical protein [Clostridia bacterium]